MARIRLGNDEANNWANYINEEKISEQTEYIKDLKFVILKKYYSHIDREDNLSSKSYAEFFKRYFDNNNHNYLASHKNYIKSRIFEIIEESTDENYQISSHSGKTIAKEISVCAKLFFDTYIDNFTSLPYLASTSSGELMATTIENGRYFSLVFYDNLVSIFAQDTSEIEEIETTVSNNQFEFNKNYSYLLAEFFRKKDSQNIGG